MFVIFSTLVGTFSFVSFLQTNSIFITNSNKLSASSVLILGALIYFPSVSFYRVLYECFYLLCVVVTVFT